MSHVLPFASNSLGIYPEVPEFALLTHISSTRNQLNSEFTTSKIYVAFDSLDVSVMSKLNSAF